jgi:1,4-dihydroxy-2-naphthoyl-CoA hydrolase
VATTLLTPDASAVLARFHAGETIDRNTMMAVFAGDDPFAGQFLGLTFETFQRDQVVARLDASERLHQPFGIVHGGVWCSVIESVASIAGWLHVALDGYVVVGVNNTTDFLRPHVTGPVEITGTPLHLGRQQHLWEVDICSEENKRVAHGQVRLHVMRPPA